MKKIKIGTVGAFGCSLVLAASLIGCSGGGQDTQSNDGSGAEQSQKAEGQQKDFDGSGMSDTGAGTMYISSAGGTSEDGNIPQILSSSDTSAMQISVNYFDGDGSICTVYVDGIEADKMNAGDAQQTVTLVSEMLTEGTHTVEVVAMDGDTPSIYKSAQYEIVF